MASSSTRSKSVMPEPECPMGYTLKDLVKHFGITVGEPHELWDIVHSVEAKCKCKVDEDGKSHGIVHPVEAFEKWVSTHA